MKRVFNLLAMGVLLFFWFGVVLALLGTLPAGGLTNDALPAYRERIEKGGMILSGTSPDGSLVEFIEPAPFTVGASIMMYLMVVVGGPGYFFGPVLGSAVGVLLPEWLRFAQAWYLFVFGALVVLLMLWLPDGLLSIPDRLKARRQAREASAARAASAAAAEQAAKKGP